MIKDNFNIPLIGDCKNKLSFIHVSDVCDAIKLFFNKSGKYIFNIAADEGEEFQLILSRLIKKANSKSKLKFINKTLGNLLFDITVPDSYLTLIIIKNFQLFDNFKNRKN